MAALAGVKPDSLGKVGYLAQRVEERSGEDGSTRFALGGVITKGLEFVDFAEGATEGAEFSGYRVFHYLSVSFRCYCWG